MPLRNQPRARALMTLAGSRIGRLTRVLFRTHLLHARAPTSTVYPPQIDYCRVGFLLRPPHVANMHRMLGRLEGVDAREAAERHAVAAKLRTAFIQREGATLDQPSAAHYLVAAMCARAQRSQAVAECALHSGHELQDVAEHDSPGPGPAGAAGGANGRMPESCLPDYF